MNYSEAEFLLKISPTLPLTHYEQPSIELLSLQHKKSFLKTYKKVDTELIFESF